MSISNYTTIFSDRVSQQKHTLKRLVVFDRNPILSEGVANAIRSDPFFAVYSVQATKEADPETLALLQPDFLMIDPDQSQIPPPLFAQYYLKLSSICVLIGYCEDLKPEKANALIAAGFRCLIPKDIQSTDLAKILTSFLCADASRLEGSNKDFSALTGHAPDPTGVLSDREVEVLRLIALGDSMKEIASLLQISIKTVDTYKNRAAQKLGLKTRAEIVRYGIRAGWLN